MAMDWEAKLEESRSSWVTEYFRKTREDFIMVS
jgi:hypothetical protein